MAISTKNVVGAKRIASFGETVFAKYSRLALELGAVNLGQGFPDFEPPEFVIEALRASANDYQQYPPLPGWSPLMEAVASKMSPRLGQNLEPVQNLQVVVGATEGLFATILALIDPGDEVVMLEPFYDAYPADTLMAGGIPKFVPLHPQADGQWELDFDELKQAFSNKTKAIIINSPHNPTGKVFSVQELDKIIDLAETYDAIIISDEVYEHISFVPHTSVASRPGGWERTVTISSVGKTFSVTGWKVGWTVAPEPLTHAIRMAHQWIPFTVAGTLQIASSHILNHPEVTSGQYYQDLTKMYKNKRDTLVDALRATPLKPLNPQGSYFVMTDSSALNFENDVALAEQLPEMIGVVAIPPSAFYSQDHKHLAKHLLRFSFSKSDAAIEDAAERLQKLS